MADYNTVEQFERALDRAIDKAMSKQIAEKVKEYIADYAQMRVYDAYADPIFNSRWGKNSGILDKDYMTVDYEASTKTLTITHEVQWQHLRGGAMPQMDLADAIQAGINSHRGGAYMYHAPARPYTNEAEHIYAARAFNDDIITELTKQGF